jgi:hypothetical protein
MKLELFVRGAGKLFVAHAGDLERLGSKRMMLISSEKSRNPNNHDLSGKPNLNTEQHARRSVGPAIGPRVQTRDRPKSAR